jgi:hypothetical protein
MPWLGMVVVDIRGRVFTAGYMLACAGAVLVLCSVAATADGCTGALQFVADACRSCALRCRSLHYL